MHFFKKVDESLQTPLIDVPVVALISDAAVTKDIEMFLKELKRSHNKMCPWQVYKTS